MQFAPWIRFGRASFVAYLFSNCISAQNAYFHHNNHNNLASGGSNFECVVVVYDFRCGAMLLIKTWALSKRTCDCTENEDINAHEIPFSLISAINMQMPVSRNSTVLASIGAAFRISERLDSIASVAMKLLLIKCSISFILLTAIDNLSCCQLNESNQFTMLLKWARLLLAIWIDLPQATRHILHIIMSYSSVVSWFVRRSGKSKRWKARTLKLFAVNRKTQTNGGEARREKQANLK